jgi:hypothetical protein
VAEARLDELPRVARAIAHVDDARATARKLTAFRELQAAHAADAAAITDDLQRYDCDTRTRLGRVTELHDCDRDWLEQRQRDEQARLVEPYWSARRVKRHKGASNQLIVRRKQFKTLLNAGEYHDAEVCPAQVRAVEESEAQEAAESMKADFKGSQRVLMERQANRRAQTEFRMETERGVVGARRGFQRRVLEHVERTIKMRSERYNEPEKAWNLTRVTQMSEISKKIQPFQATVPASNREEVRARGRLAGQTLAIKRPPLDFERLERQLKCSVGD